MRSLRHDKRGYDLPDWFDISLSITVGAILFFGFISLGSITKQTIQAHAYLAQEDISDAYNLINYLRTHPSIDGRPADDTFGELLVYLFHDPAAVRYTLWSKETRSLFDSVFGENNWFLTIRFPDPIRFFNDDGESIETANAWFPRQMAFAGTRVTSVHIPTMDPEQTIEVLLHIRED